MPSFLGHFTFLTVHLKGRSLLPNSSNPVHHPRSMLQWVFGRARFNLKVAILNGLRAKTQDLEGVVLKIPIDTYLAALTY
jgi:hypothetical protein